MKHFYPAIRLLVLAGITASVSIAAAPAAQQDLTLEKIMADPDWIGPAVSDAYWSVDDRAVYYSIRRGGSPIVDLHRVELAGHKDQIVDANTMADADGPPIFDRAGKRAAFVRNGDIFVRDVAGGRLMQITRTSQNNAGPQSSADSRILSFRVGNY